MEFRNLNNNDFYNGYLELLSQLTEVNIKNITFKNFSNFIDNLNDKNHKIIVIIYKNNIVASGTLLMEDKIIHGISKIGHIEDIVVDSKYRGRGIGKKLINYLTILGIENNCYKLILNCKEENCEFYRKSGFVRKEIEMVKYIDFAELF